MLYVVLFKLRKYINYTVSETYVSANRFIIFGINFIMDLNSNFHFCYEVI